jgi:putative addiction module antidote
MPYVTKLRKIGNSLGVVLPKEAIAALKVKEGAKLYLTEAPEGKLEITAGDAEFAESMALAEDLMGRYRNALKELAK